MELGRQRVQNDELAVDRVSDARQGVVIALALHELAFRSFRKGTMEAVPRDREAPVRRRDRYRNHQAGLAGDGFVLQRSKVRLDRGPLALLNAKHSWPLWVPGEPSPSCCLGTVATITQVEGQPLERESPSFCYSNLESTW